MVDNSAYDMKTISYLLNLGDLILEEYSLWGYTDFSGEQLLKYFDMEDDLYSSLSITERLLKEVEAIVSEKIGVCPTSPLPNGINSLMTSKNYPYLRLLARTRYLFNAKVDLPVSLMQDVEIGLFYNSLLTEANDNPQSSRRLKKYAWQILIDSPTIEKQVILNDMAALPRIDDYLPFCIDLLAVDAGKKQIGLICYPHEINIIKKKSDRFHSLMQEVLKLAEKYKNLEDSGISSRDDIIMSSAYLNAIIATQEKGKREFLYAQSFQDTNGDAKERTKIEDILVPCIWQFDFIDRKKLR